MVTSLRVEDKFDGTPNFRSWKAKILFILEENEIDVHVKRVSPKPIDDEGKAKHKIMKLGKREYWLDQ